MTIKREMSFSELDKINPSLPSFSAILSNESLLNLATTNSGKSDEDECTNCTISDTDDEITSVGCRQFTEYEFTEYIANIPILQLFKKSWEIDAAPLDRVCGIGGCMVRCSCVSASGKATPNKLQEWFTSKLSIAFQSLFRFLIPCSVPYMMHYSEASGPVCLTPFFSILCNRVKVIPQELFMLSKLNLGHVVNNPIFCHELAFNPDLYIKDPSSSCSSKDLYRIWKEVIREIKDIKQTPLTPSPFQILPQILEGIRVMMHSILPVCLGSEIDFHLDPTQLLSSDRDSNHQYVEELVGFICAVLETCVIPMRRNTLDQLKTRNYQEQTPTAHFVKIIILAIDLLNYTKVDRINSQLKDRASLLLLKTVHVDKKYFVSLVETGNIDVVKMTAWLSIQPSVNTLRSLAFPDNTEEYITISNPLSDKNKESTHFSQLVGGFVLNYLAPNGIPPSLQAFPLDNSRIRALRKRFHMLIMKCLVVEVLRLYPKRDEQDVSDLRLLITKPDVTDTKIYKLLELRTASEVASEVFEKLCRVFYNENGPQRNEEADTIKMMAICDDDMVKEIITLLYLHWSSARDYYCQAT